MEAQGNQNLQPSSTRTSLARGLDHFRGFVGLLAVLGAVVLGGIYFAKQQVDPFVCQQCEKKLNEFLSPHGISVRVASARFVEGTGITIDDLEIREREGRRSLVATVDRITLESKLRHVDLINQPFTPQCMIVQGLKLHARPTENGWNLEKLFAIKQSSPRFVPIEINDSSMLLFADANAETPATTLRDINLRFLPRQHRGSTVAQSSVKSDGQAKSDVMTSQTPRTATVEIVFRGSLQGDHVGKIQVIGGFQPRTKKWGVAGDALGINISPELAKVFPTAIAEKLKPLAALSGRVACKFSVGGTDFKTIPVFDVAGRIQHGSIQDPRLPSPLTELNADFNINNQAIEVTNIQADSSLGKVQLAFKKRGLLNEQGTLDAGPIELSANIQELFLNERLAETIPESAQDIWRKFSPSGPINLDLKMSYVDGRWNHDLNLELLDVSISYYKLPYRLEGCRGTVKCDRKHCQIDVSALAAGAIVRFEGDFEDPGREMVGKLDFHLEGQVPIDEKLLAALKPNPSLYDNVRSYQPTGMITVNGSLRRFRTPDNRIQEDKNYAIGVQGATVVYEHFPYPFSNVSGQIVVNNEIIRFQNIEGQNDSGYAICNGQIDPQNGLTLKFNCQTIELEDELKRALNPTIQSLWTNLRPHGSIDQAVVVLTKPPQQELGIRIRLEKLKPTEGIERDPLSINPVWFPYATTDVVGAVDYQNGKLIIHKVSGRHGDTRISIAGAGSFTANGWAIELQQINFDRLNIDREIIAALPESLASAVEGLNVKGMINIAGSFGVQQQYAPAQVAQVSYLSPADSYSNSPRSNGNSPNGPENMPTFDWDLQLDMAGGSMLTGLPLTNIYGGARFIGTSTAADFYSSGRIEVDSLLCNGFPLTSLSGPIWVDATRIGLGGWAAPLKVETERQLLTANMFGGKLTFDALVALSEDMPFQIQASLEQTDLKTAMAELSPSTENVEGLGFARVSLVGNRHGTHTYRGNGSVRLTAAKISEVPVMLAMLKLLSVKQVDRTAFNESNIDFAIEGDHCYFRRLEFLGDAISLKGNGEMSFDQEIRLNFYTGVGKDSFRIPIISPLFGAASQSILLVQVDGSLSQPLVTKQLFPRLNDSLQEMFPELAEQSATASPRGRTRKFR